MNKSQKLSQGEKSFFEKATIPNQYDSKEVKWDIEGDGDDCIRRMFLEMVLSQTKISNTVMRHLDLGCGTGWLSGHLAKQGLDSTGIDASTENIRAAKHRYPHANFKLLDFVTEDFDQNYNLITATMSFEHVASPFDVAKKVNANLLPEGRFIMIFGDYEYFTKPRFDVVVELERNGADDEISVQTNYGGNFGILYDVFRRPHVYESAFREAGFSSISVIPFAVPDWLIKERPEYSIQANETMFQLLIADV